MTLQVMKKEITKEEEKSKQDEHLRHLLKASLRTAEEEEEGEEKVS